MSMLGIGTIGEVMCPQTSGASDGSSQTSGASMPVQQMLQMIAGIKQMIASMMSGSPDQAGASQQSPALGAQANGPQMPDLKNGTVCHVPVKQGETAPAGGSTNNASNPPATQDTSSKDGSSAKNSVQDVINGDAKNGASADDKPPEDMSLDQIKQLDGGLLGKTGNQQITGAGTDGIQGSKGIADLVAKQAGYADSSGLDDTPEGRQKAWKMLEEEEKLKNANQANGQQASADTRHNGNLSGLQGGDIFGHGKNEVASNSDLAMLQNESKGQANLGKGGPSDKMNANGEETTGAQQVGQKILDGVSDVVKWGGKILSKVFPEFGTAINLASKGLSMGLDAAGDAVNGQDVGADMKQKGEDLLKNPMDLIF